MQIIYHYDPVTMIFDQTIMVEKVTDQLQASTTTVSPNNVVQPAKWDPAAQKWIGQSIDDWHAQNNNQEAAPQPTAEQQALTALAQQIADNDTNTATQITSIEQALTALATGTTKNGGNA